MQEQRKNYFIKKEFQAKFILKFCILICMACILMGGLIYFLSAKTITTSFENLRLVAKSTADFILPALALSSITAIILISLACVFIVLFISHRIAGPLYRFERCLEQIAKGDLTLNTCLREKDEIKILAQGLNDMTEKLREILTMSQDQVEELRRKAVSIKEGFSQLGIAQSGVEKIMAPYEENLKRLEETLKYFKV